VGPLLWFLGCIGTSYLAAYLPVYEGLSDPGRDALFILVLAAALWMTEAIPAFATALVVVALEMLMLTEVGPWEQFLAPWSSPVIWLFFGGFVLAAAAVRSGLDRWLSGWVLSLTGDRPPFVLLGAMGSTFVFSMFMSNTATATMMLSVLLPVIAVMDKAARLRTVLPVSVAFAANIGGMGTIIGSPPNAIAAGLLQAQDPITFMGWLLVALPVAILLAGVTWLFLAWPVWKDPAVDLSRIVQSSRPILALWQRLVVMTVFTVTVLLWMSGPIHGIPTAVVSFLPITILTMTRTIGVDEIRSLPWDVLLLVAGGLALGVGIEGSGLAAWLVAFLPVDDLGPIGLVLGLAWICSALSNFMSNTAASNILLPISVALGGGQIEYVMPIALAASAAMCLPVSTPPNALAASRAGPRSMDFLPGGLLVGILAAPAAVAACFVYFA
jgi:sodium-dependent dicarboxylate transporter 2/3/5